MVDKDDIELRVLLILPNLRIGGSQEVVRTLAKYMALDGCTPVVCALYASGPLFDDLVQQGTQVEVLHLPRRPFLAFPWYMADMIRIWRRLSQVMVKHKINVIQTTNLGSIDFHVLALAHVMGIPLTIFQFQNERFLPLKHGDDLRNRMHRLAYHLARPWTSDYVAVSVETKQTMVRSLRLSEKEVTVICNGVDVDRYQQPVDRNRVRRQLGFNADAKLLITVGTLKLQKGHHYLIKAAAEVICQYPDAHFLFVGDGELKPVLQAQTNSCGLSGHIHFLGDRRDISALLAASDVFVLPSLWEGLSVALLEAMAAAKPIVATAVSGTSQAIRHNETGILVSPGDAEALAQAIITMLSKPVTYACVMGEAAQHQVKTHFGMEKQAAEYLTLYRRLMAKGVKR